MSGLEQRKRLKRKERRKKRKERKAVRKGDLKAEERARSWMIFLWKTKQLQVYSSQQREVSLRLEKEKSSKQEARRKLVNHMIQLEEVSKRKKDTDPSQRIGGVGETKKNEIRISHIKLTYF